MSANLTVPADVWACRQPGVPFVAAIVEWEGKRRKVIDGREVGVETFPPAWLVALRDARCETCERTFDRMKGKYTDAAWQAIPQRVKRVMREDVRRRCPDCDGTGRLLHDVWVECDQSNCIHGVLVMRDAVEPTDDDIVPCPDCCTVRCLIDVVPVVKWAGTTTFHGHEPPALVVNHDGGVSLFADYTTSEQLTSAHIEALSESIGITEPADWPGKYAVILTEVDE